MFTAFHTHDSHYAGKMRSPRTRRPRFELARGQKSVFHDDFQVQEYRVGENAAAAFFFSSTPPLTEMNSL